MNFQRWLAEDPDPQTKAELQQLDPQERAQRFAGRLQFGTAGLRGLLGAGPVRMNRLVVRQTTAGLARALAVVPQAAARGVVIGFDGRHKSHEFAEDAAGVLKALGFRVHGIAEASPTPLCAFAVKHLRAAAGIMITASHNPKEYNGYKVYWENGAQIIPPHDARIAAAIEVAAAAQVPWQAGPYNTVDVFQAYLAAIARPEQPRRLRVAYTALHGVGAPLAEVALRQAGFEQVFSVPAQRMPDPDFPTVAFPNPEEPGAMDQVLALAQQKNADLACANDPDADRLAVAVRRPDGTYQTLTGDQVGVLLADQCMASPGGAVGTSVVSSQMMRAMAQARGVEYFETLTGFKWLANAALAHPGTRFTYEEALGYCVGDVVLDKDGICALVAFADLASRVNVLQQLEVLYRRHGLFLTAQKSLWVPSPEEFGARARVAPPRQIAGYTVLRVRDLLHDPEGLPPSDVLIFQLEGGHRVIMRPSGTEPKFKCYYELVETVASHEAFDVAQARAALKLRHLITQHEKEFDFPLAIHPGSL